MTPPQSVLPGPVSEFLASVVLAPRQACKALTLWPLVWREGARPMALRKKMARKVPRRPSSAASAGCSAPTRSTPWTPRS